MYVSRWEWGRINGEAKDLHKKPNQAYEEVVHVDCHFFADR